MDCSGNLISLSDSGVKTPKKVDPTDTGTGSKRVFSILDDSGNGFISLSDSEVKTPNTIPSVASGTGTKKIFSLLDDSGSELISLSDSGVKTPKKMPSKVSNAGTKKTFTLLDSGSVTGGGHNQWQNNDFLSASNASVSVSNNYISTSTTSAASTEETGLLVDLNGGIQIPVPHALLTQAEIDDTFGVFAKIQKAPEPDDASKKSVPGTRTKEESNIESSTNYNTELKERAQKESEDCCKNMTADADDYSIVPGTKLNSSHSGTEVPNAGNNVIVGRKSTDSVESYSSDQPTIVDEDIEDLDDEEKGICDINMDLGFGSNLSAGSDSEILDINNMSSFSLPDIDLDENKYLEDIKDKDMAKSAVSAAIINQIKLELLQEEDKVDSVRIPSLRGSYRDNDDDHTHNSNDFETYHLKNHRHSIASSIDNGGSSTARSSLASNFGQEHSSTTKASRDKNALRISGIGSPIRTSYPLSKYMPTPNAKTPNRALRNLSESLCSPTRTRVFLQTGGGVRVSPSRVPVRKSISAETLHFQSPNGNSASQMKFSTPSSRHRYSYHITSVIDNVENNLGNSMGESDAENIWMKPRLSRVSFAGAPSTTTTIDSIPSPTSFTIKREREISLLSKQLHTTIELDKKTATVAPSTTGIKPLIATVKGQPQRTHVSNSTEPARNTRINASPAPGKPKATFSGQGKFIPPVAASSPRLGPSPVHPRLTVSQTTPSRNKLRSNIRSSGYGPQNLNATFGATKLPLTSPNKTATQPAQPQPQPSMATVKPAAIPRSLKVGIPSLGAKSRIGPSASAPLKTGLPVPRSGTTGFLPRPTQGAALSNKENNVRVVESKLGRPRLH